MLKLTRQRIKIPFDFQVSRECVNCQNQFTGMFCNVCGEKVLIAEEKSLKNFFGSVINALTFLDTKFLRTLRLMLTNPGEMSRQYMHGRRVPFIKPISLFFVVNLLYFIFTFFETYNSKLYTQMHWLPHKGLATRMVEERIQREQITLEAFTIKYESQSTNIAKLMLIVFVFLISIFIAIINFSKKLFFVDHIFVSLEFNSTFILITNVIFPWVLLFIARTLQLVDIDIISVLNDNVYTLIMVGFAMILLYRIERTVYGQQKVWAVVKSVLMVPALYISLHAYRALLFFVTIWTI